MKITTRIISGYGLFIAILAGLVIYQVITINDMRRIIQALREVNFQNAETSLNAMRDMDLVDEYAQKSFTVNPEYLGQLANSQDHYEANLRELRNHAISREEQDSIRRLAKSWESFAAKLELLKKGFRNEDWIVNLKDDLESLKMQTKAVYDASLRSMSDQINRSEETGKNAAFVLYSVILFALLVSILVSFLILRSISKPLASLTEGTRAIAEGKFFYRLDTSRSDEFSQLAKDFNTMTQRLNELDELKKDFVSHVSHELKAPLASMRETIQLLLDEIPGPLTEKQKRLLQLNLQSEMRLTTMIGNLLDLSRTEAGLVEYELKRHDLIPLVRNAIAELDVQAQERKINMETAFPNAPLPVECDSDRMVQVLVNLVGNALKFSPKGGTVQVKVEAIDMIPSNVPERWHRLLAKPGDGRPYGLVTISDNGPGVPDSDKEKIFERFHQIKRGQKVPGQGVGLGLAICRTIVQANRGAIWAEDNPGGGSRFRLLLRPGLEGEDAIPRGSVPI